MKRLCSVLLFLLLAGGAFWGILCYAKHLEAERRQEQHPVSKVVVLTDLSPDLLDPVKDAFYKEQGLAVEISYVSGADLLKKTSAEEKAADVVITSQDILMRMKENGELAAYSSSRTDTALNLFKDEEAYWTGLWVDPIVFAVNPDFLKTQKTFSYTWAEVFTREEAQLSMTDFIAAEMSKDLLMCLIEHFGPDYAMELLGRAQQHLVQYGKYLSTPSRMAAMGKCDIGISGLNEVLRTKREKMPVMIIYPEDGAPWYLYGTGLLAESAHPERGERLIDWLLDSVKYKSIMEKNGNYFIYVNDDAAEPDAAGNELVFWELEKRYLDEGRKDLLNLWGEKVRFGGTKK